MTLKILCFVCYLSGLTQMCLSMTCSPLTLNSCTKSLYVTGNCVAGECECVNGAIPIRYGCVKPTKPTVTVKVSTGDGKIDQSKWSKEGSPGVYEFHCSPRIEGRGKYKWFRNGVELKTSGNSELKIYVSASTWTFQCALNVDGYSKDKSDAFDITVKGYGERFTMKPQVTGIPDLIALNSVFKIFCSNIPSFLGAFMFNINGVDKREIFPETYVNMTADTFGKNVTCSVKPESETWSVTSHPVTLPVTPATDIPEVIIEGRKLYYYLEPLSLRCVFKQSFASVVGFPVKFYWTGPTVTAGQTGQYYYKNNVSSIDAGDYTCKASYQNQPAKTSPGFKVSYVNLGLVSLSVQPKKPVIGGYLSLTCLPSKSSELYTWNFLPQYSDNTVQLNAIGAGDFGQWMSCDFKIRGGHGDSKYISAPLPLSDIPPPTIEGASKTNNPDLYTMECNSDYGTPGAIVEWHVDDEKEDENSNTFEFLQNDTKKAFEIQCRLSFNSAYSEFSKKVIIPRKGSVAIPVIDVKYSPRSFIVDASYTLWCSSVIQTNASYSWKKNGVKLPTTNHRLVYQGVNNSIDGNYTCTVSLGDEIKESEPFEIVVHDHIEAPVIEVFGSSFIDDYGDLKILEEGHTYYLRCSTPADSELARYSWKKGSKFLNVPDNILRLHAVTSRDIDLYSCEISVGGKTGVSSQAAIVVGHDTAIPKVLASDNHKSFNVGRNYTLVCANYKISKLSSVATFSWKKDDKIISTTTGSLYNLNNIQKKDLERYTCSVTIGKKTFESKTYSTTTTTPGKFCSSDKDCLGLDDVKNPTCKGGRCVCESGVIFDGKKCHGNIITYSGLLLVLTIICYKLYFNQF